jgi:histidine phosphotransfer protein HptB
MMRISLQALARMRELIGGDKDVLADILQSLIDEADPLAESVLAAARDGKFNTLRRAAHAIKSSARDFGDSELAALCADVELGSRQGLMADAIASAHKIAECCIALKRDLAAYIGSDLNGEAL